MSAGLFCRWTISLGDDDDDDDDDDEGTVVMFAAWTF